MTDQHTHRLGTEPLDYAVKYTEKLTLVVETLAPKIGERIAALDELQEEGEITNPERLRLLADELFKAADTLIYLAEDTKGVAARAARRESEDEPERDTGFNRDEDELYTMLLGFEGVAVGIDTLLDHGFGISISSDNSVRKTRLQRTIKTLSAKLIRDGSATQIMKIGQARGTKYFLQTEEGVEPFQEEAAEPSAPSTTEPEKIPSQPARPDMTEEAARLRKYNQEALLKNLVAGALDTYQAQNPKRPIVCFMDIVILGFKENRATPDQLEALRAHLEANDRVAPFGKGEYRIVNIELTEDWIDTESLDARLDQFISRMQSKRNLYVPFAHALKQVSWDRAWLTRDEKSYIIQRLYDDNRVVSLKTSGDIQLRPFD